MRPPRGPISVGARSPSAADGPAYRVTAEFSDVLDLVPQAAVKVDDVTVGSVEKISLSGWTARVRLRVGRNVDLPANATAAVPGDRPAVDQLKL